MAQKVLLKRSSVSGRMPNAITGTSVEKGELFMNIATGTNVNNFLTTLKANGNSANTGDYIKWSDDKYNESKYQPKGNYLTSYTETYKGTITGVTAGNGLTGGGTKSTGSTGLTLHVGSGTGITVSADSVSISTEYQNKIASGTSAYTIANTLSGALIDVEYVVANALNKINESAGFDENGNSTLPNGVSLTDAINAKPDTDTLNTVGATDYTSSDRLQFIGVTSGASASKQSYLMPNMWSEGGTLYVGGGRTKIGTGIETGSDNSYNIGSSGYRFKESFINIMHGKADSATTANSATTATSATTAKSATTANSATTATSATSATKLANTRTLWGQNFNGEANVTGDMSGVGSLSMSGNLTLMVSNQHNTDQYINFKYSTTDLDNYSWRIGYKGSGSGNENNFVIQTNGSGAWEDALKIGLNDKIVYCNASSAKTATSATTAATASSATTARSATTATSATTAVSATTATSAKSATTATSATTANSATTATSAKSATTATSATTANSATTIKVTNVTTGTRYLVGVSASTTATGASLNVYNGVYMSGNLLYATSDERLKDFTDNISVDFEALKNIPKKYFYWKDKENRGTAKEIGTSAQKLMEVYPEIVTIDDKGNFGVSYERLSIIALAAIDKLHERIKILEEKLNDK